MGDRHQFRAKWHDYNNGIYFVTVCVKDMKQSLGRIIDGEMTLYNVGRHLEYWIEKLKTGSDIEVIDYFGRHTTEYKRLRKCRNQQGVLAKISAWR